MHTNDAQPCSRRTTARSADAAQEVLPEPQARIDEVMYLRLFAHLVRAHAEGAFAAPKPAKGSKAGKVAPALASPVSSLRGAPPAAAPASGKGALFTGDGRADGWMMY